MEVPATQTTVRCFVSLSPDRSEDGGGYRAITDVMSSNDLRKQLLKQAEKELRGFEQKYSQLTELTAIFDKARNVFESLKDALSGSLSETLEHNAKHADDILRPDPDFSELKEVNAKLHKSIDNLEERNKTLEETVLHLESYIGKRLKSQRKKLKLPA